MSGIDSYAKLVLHMDGVAGSTVFIDSSEYAHAVTAQSTAQISGTSIFVNQSGLFSSNPVGGGGAYLLVASSPQFHLAGDDFTIDGWFRPQVLSNAAKEYFIAVGAPEWGSNTGAFAFQKVTVAAGTYDLQFSFMDSSGVNTDVAWRWTPSPALNSTNHLACERYGTSLHAFVNGIKLGTSYNIGATLVRTHLDYLTIGNNILNNDSPTGYSLANALLDEWRFSPGISRYQGENFTPPTEAYSVATNPRTGPEKYRVVIRDRDFVQREIIEDEFMNLQWSYSRIGGCGSCSFELPRKRFQERAITGEYNIMIYHRNPHTNQWDLWYQGLVENKIPKLSGNTETIPFQGHGYQTQLSRIYLNNLTFTNTEVSSIVAQIMGTYVQPYTDINFDASLIATTEFTPSTITFNENALSAITKLADLVGQREWGVDLDRDFFFVKRSSDIGFRFLHGRNITQFEDNQDFTQIVNQVYVQGAQVGGTYHFFGPYNSLNSQAKYGLRTEIFQNSSIKGTDVAEQFADSILIEKQEVSRRASCSLAGYVGLMESTVPIGLFMELDRGNLYGEKKYGTFLYGGTVGRVINRINYSVTKNNALTVRLDLGQLRPNLSEQISQLSYTIEQTQQAAL